MGPQNLVAEADESSASLGVQVSEFQGQRLRGKCAPKNQGFGMKTQERQGQGLEGRGARGGKGEWSAVFWEGVGTRLQMGASRCLKNLQGSGTEGSVVPVNWVKLGQGLG